VVKSATKATPAVNNQVEFLEDDFDAINAQLRDAYELREFDAL
jgi:hypothetical protein